MAQPPLLRHPFLHRLPPSPAINTGSIDSVFSYSAPYNERTNTYDLNSKIMLTAIISLSVVVLVVMALHIYARFVLRRRTRERAFHHSLRLTSAAVADIHSGEPPRAGLDPAVIASLPIFVFKHNAAAASRGGDESELECAVCLSCVEEEEMARILPNCKHIFHAECIDKWLSCHSNCPICRTEAQPRIEPVPREGPAAGAPPEGSSSNKVGGSVSRLSSFRRMLSRERSSRTIFQAEIQEGGSQDLERQ